MMSGSVTGGHFSRSRGFWSPSPRGLWPLATQNSLLLVWWWLVSMCRDARPKLRQTLFQKVVTVVKRETAGPVPTACFQKCLQGGPCGMLDRPHSLGGLAAHDVLKGASCLVAQGCGVPPAGVRRSGVLSEQPALFSPH